MPFDGVEFRATAASSPPAASTVPHWVAKLLERARAAGRLRRPQEDDATVALRLLGRARSLIERRERWVQGAYQTYYG